MSLFGLVNRGLRRLCSLAGADGFALPIPGLERISQFGGPLQIVPFAEVEKQLADGGFACCAGLSHDLQKRALPAIDVIVIEKEHARNPVKRAAAAERTASALLALRNLRWFSMKRDFWRLWVKAHAGPSLSISLAYLSTTEVYP